MVLKCIIMEQEETVIALFGANIHLKMKTHAYDFHCYALLETVAGLHGLDKCVYVNNANKDSECKRHSSGKAF